MLFYYLLTWKTMKKLFLLIAIAAIVTSCSQTSEQTRSESDLDIFNYVLSKITTSSWEKLAVEHQAVLIITVLQNRDQTICLKYLNLNGKKQLNLALRKAVNALLELTNEGLDTKA